MVCKQTKKIDFEKLILKQISDAIIITDNNNCITYLNTAAQVQYNLSEHEALGQSLSKLYTYQWINPEDEIAFITALETQEHWCGENLHIKNNGKIIIVHSSISTFKENGQKIGLLNVIRDITALKDKDNTLVNCCTNFENIIRVNSNGMMVVDLQGIVQFVNPSIQNLFQMYGGLLGNPFGIPVGTEQPDEVNIVRKNGEIGIAEMNTVEIQWKGEPAYLVTLHDITKRKQIEDALKTEQAALAKNTEKLKNAIAELAHTARLKDEFLANMSHELRTPLNAILGGAEILQEQVFGSLNVQQDKFIQRIESSGKHLLNLISDILDLSKIASGQFDLVFDDISVHSVCQESLQLVQQAAQKKQIKLRFSFDYMVSNIEADELRLKQILVNLLTNAIKFTPEGGFVQLVVSGIPEQELIEFMVTDTGIGIAESDFTKLFQPFVQIDGGLSRQQEGTGLGLALVATLVEMHGGNISVASQVGKGSHFTVTLPWQEDSEDSEDLRHQNKQKELSTNSIEVEKDLPVATSTSGKILLVDDHEKTIDMLSNYLVIKGYQVIIAHDGAEAILQAQTEHPDLILMDIQMPRIDGLEAIRMIRSNPKQTNLPIIALTALVMSGDKERCLAAGANEYLSKPVNLKHLLQKIESLLLLPEVST